MFSADGSGLFGQTVRAGGSLCAQASAFVNQTLGLLEIPSLVGNTSVGGTLKVAGTTCLQSSAVVNGALQQEMN